MAGQPPPADLLWSTGHIWRNQGDRAIWRNADGDEVDSHCYGDLCP